jgi:hypothetical protein
VAFLQMNRPALATARNVLSHVSPPADLPAVKDGVIELPMANGKMMKMHWPPNLDVVDGLFRCFDQPYKVAYSDKCRGPTP